MRIRAVTYSVHIRCKCLFWLCKSACQSTQTLIGMRIRAVADSAHIRCRYIA